MVYNWFVMYETESKSSGYWFWATPAQLLLRNLFCKFLNSRNLHNKFLLSVRNLHNKFLLSLRNSHNKFLLFCEKFVFAKEHFFQNKEICLQEISCKSLPSDISPSSISLHVGANCSEVGAISLHQVKVSLHLQGGVIPSPWWWSYRSFAIVYLLRVCLCVYIICF